MEQLWIGTLLETLRERRQYPLGIILDGPPSFFAPLCDRLRACPTPFKLVVFLQEGTTEEEWKLVFQDLSHTIFPEGYAVAGELVDNSKADYVLVAHSPSDSAVDWFAEFHSMFCLDLTLLCWPTFLQGLIREKD